jgi:predicted acylesterase/phospholipase RssA
MDTQQSIKDTLNQFGYTYAILLGTDNTILTADAVASYLNWPFGQIVTTATLPGVPTKDFVESSIVDDTNSVFKITQSPSPQLARRFAQLIAEGGWVAVSMNEQTDQALISLIKQMPETNMPSFWLFDKVPPISIQELIKGKNAVMLSVLNLPDWFKSFKPGVHPRISKGSSRSRSHTDSRNDKPQYVNILSIDGGGIRGVIPALILDALERKTQKSINQLFDIVAGTSTGGILALGLTAPKTPGSIEARHSAADLADLYVTQGTNIFPKHPSRVPRFWQILAQLMTLSRFKPINSGGQLLNTVFAKPYPDDGIESTLKKYFTYEDGTDIPLLDALKEVLITSYDIQSRTIELMTRERAVTPENNYYMREAARATSAAPSFFRPFVKVGERKLDQKTLVDGGLFANNPALCAYVHAKRLFPLCLPRILSIGTGCTFEPIDSNAMLQWNTGQWTPELINSMFYAGSACADQNLSKLIPRDENKNRCYIRLQVDLGKIAESIDDTDNVQALASRTKNALENELKDDLEEVFQWF